MKKGAASTMNYGGIMIAVKDMNIARQFYEELMEQKVMMNLDNIHVVYESGFSMQADYAGLLDVSIEMKEQANNFQLYFEVEDLAIWEEKLSKVEGIEFLHHSKEYPWGQRVMRFYDPDKFIVEVSESMTSVAKRYLAQGLSIEETAEKTMFPVAFVKELI
ncbi:MAG: glyoxalase/bleomycin resistance/dioxygenase family protein [Enterococcus sp.]|uniref:VOC family protein n=1 Tax=Enterococcus sp. TaxID=35783 RepID=UPI002648E8B1|nr:VOC family protein [Enterococcus sp.]MDN6217924.1 glyoxalase/bleomycin resistance/dioxygenase family protein [Enterococcus sp.]MDN6517566.1 glyoxalase/bleomycin resistance/dioxygenase family protein [Enterococcus sp.]MDN6562762.1 glyoxalase/bleomycin resistance/dioxygenase family protein [Enterococcus sp.]MDN6583935.1 glyoxalase/bleomycin resistance/dioxygenase family protein [Enterococcus sp.]MDN6616275.1 glyoxalase/bleomycin resistance/dioxygenase family protein [Enterococcus sp.]